MSKLTPQRSHHSHVSTKDLRLQPCGPVPPLSYPSDGTKPQFTVPTPARQHTCVVELHQLSAISYNGASLALPAPYHSTIHHICLGALTLRFQEAQGQPCNNTKCHMPWNKTTEYNYTIQRPHMIASMLLHRWAQLSAQHYGSTHITALCVAMRSVYPHTQALSPIWGQILSSWT